MPWGLNRYQQTRELHFITFCCYHRRVLLESKLARNEFVVAIERVRKWYGFYVVGYVVMPEHVHLLISEPERGTLALSLQMLKQVVSRKLGVTHGKEHRFLQKVGIRAADFERLFEGIRTSLSSDS